MTGRGDHRRTGCAVLLTAAVALPAGFWLAGALRTEAVDGSGAPREVDTPAAARAADTGAPAVRPAPEVRPAPAVRNVYSGNIRGDPYVLARQRALVEAMERDCEATGANCPDARAARRYLDARAAED